LRFDWHAGCAAALLLAAAAAQGASVESFSPSGEVKGVRQAVARFSAPMVALGDPRLPAPFDVECGVAGSGRWVDTRNWVYDFEHDLPAGERCAFTVRDGITALDGAPLAAASFRFSTGGPAIVQALPAEGSRIDEEQIFMLALDAAAEADSLLAAAWCDVQGVTERVPVRLIDGEQRRQILAAHRNMLGAMLKGRSVEGQGGLPPDSVLATPPGTLPLTLLQCQRRLPNNAQVRLVWGQGIRSASGVPTSGDQALAFRVREVFEARFTCERANKDAHCLPIMPMRLSFSAPVARADAQKIALRGASGKAIEPSLPEAREAGDFVNEVVFTGPFAERAQFTLELPARLADDAGRALVNQRRFPLTVRTDEYPPLAKFPARFGIIELNGDGLLPVTLRNLEGLVESRLLKIGKEDSEAAELSSRADIAMNWLRNQLETSKGKEGGPVPGSYSRIADGDVAAMIRWMRKLGEFEQDRSRWDEKTQQTVYEYRVGSASIFTDQERPRRMHVPKPQGARAFEVVGIPLKKPGFYVVELASPKLGAALLGDRGKPYFVQTAALVTNVAVHFKWGRESSLVWVTALDSGAPLARAKVAVQDCAGKVYVRGETDALGRFAIGNVLPERERLPGCLSQWDRQLVVSARVADDVGLVFSGWNEGISRWRFNLRSGGWDGPFIATTVFDRSLLRAGETVSMKHYYRRHTMKGFNFAPVDQLPKTVVIQHLGSDEKYELPLRWDGRNSAESTWQIPAGARKGTYQVLMADTLDSRPGRGRATRVSGSFRVEDFRVPLMKASISGPPVPTVATSALELELSLRYLSGGSAGGAPVTLRGIVRPRSVTFAGYDGFSFAGGGIEPGIERDGSEAWTAGGDESGDADGAIAPPADGTRAIRSQALALDDSGGARATVTGLPLSQVPQELVAEMEYQDPNGETLTAATRIALWPSKLLLGVKPDGWSMSADGLKFQVVVLDLAGRPVAGRKVQAGLLLRQPFAHRKRLVGGFYGYESGAEISKLPDTCEGVSDARGRVFCHLKPGVSGNVFMVAQAADDDGNVARANASAWLAGKDDWWFDASDDDRIDVIPERKRYEPGENARLQVRMPFRSATALVTVEREGVIESYVQPLTAANPVIRLPIRNSHAPNVFVSVLVVRGRVDDVRPTALIDLGKPAFKMGVAEIQVGWRAHELNVSVKPDKEVYRVRDKARVTVRVTRKQGGKPVKGAEVAIAAVDEGLLELLPNDSWQLLATMMNARGIEVDTATASMQVVGKRHYGRKALPAGGGGGRESARELFDTLLLWKARVPLNDKGVATVDIPLNDALSGFRIVAIADAGAGLFGTAGASIRTAQDLQLLSGLPPLVRSGDRFHARFTVRNASARAMTVEVGGSAGEHPLPGQRLQLAAGAGGEVGWEISAPAAGRTLDWALTATEIRDDGPVRGDRLRVSQQVIDAVPVRTLQATIAQVGDGALSVPVARPEGALLGRGGIRVELKPRLGDDLPGVRDFMQHYAYSCLEQQVSRAVALRDEALWARIMEALPAYLDRDGLARYFAQERRGSDTLSAYLLAIAGEAGWPIPEAAKARLLAGLRGFVEGRVLRDSPLPTADLAIRKVAALDALSRSEAVDASLLTSISLEPNLWPTSAVIDWHGLLARSALPDRERRLAEAEQILRSRLGFQGTTMGFSTERADYLWWLMVSGDVNASRLLLAFMEDERWREDMPRLVRGLLGRQQHGRWNTTVANAWGVLALRKFSNQFEKVPVDGTTSVAMAGEQGAIDWGRSAAGGSVDVGWPSGAAELGVRHQGGGRPWVTVQSRAALPLAQALNAGYSVRRSVTPVEQRAPDRISRGDTLRVRLEIEARSDMAWVVVEDPVPAGTTLLGRGLGGEPQSVGDGEAQRSFVWPAFEERSFESFRAYYRFVPKGTWVVEYTMRVNNPGRFLLPPTRVEAMYAPEMFALLPNDAVVVEP
jgi:alpha-2-macroglobulin